MALIPLLLLSLLVLALSQLVVGENSWQRVTPDSTVLWRTVFHTESGKFEAGCKRTFIFHSSETLLSFNVTVERLRQTPLISSQLKPDYEGGSINDFNFNAAYVPLFDNDRKPRHALLVRSQNRTSSSRAGRGTPSELYLAFEADGRPGDFAPIDSGDLSFFPIPKTENFGTEDPRIAYDEKSLEWLLFYTAVQQMDNGGLQANLSLATTKDILDPTAWVRQGVVIADEWSKSGALLIRPVNETSYLFWGDSDNGRGMSLAETDDLRTFKKINPVWLPKRPLPYFDNILVEGGPPPERLTSGDFFYLHNTAGELKLNGSSYANYHLSFLILDKKDPTNQLFRSPVPILSCELGWEIGQSPWLDLTPYVVFSEGMRRFPEAGPDSWLLYYGGADSVVGGAIVTVKFDETAGIFDSNVQRA